MHERDELWEIERQSGTYFVGHQAGLEEGREQGLEQGLEQGREQGLEQGREQGLEQGREQGQRQALSELILGLLADRGVTIDPASEAQIRGEKLPVLQRWARRVSEVRDLDELLARA